MPRIGIFWVLKGAVIGRARETSEGVECDGRIDSPDQHVTLWRCLPEFSKLRKVGDGYEAVPRGRVVWFRQENKAIVYLDRKLLNSAASRTKITDFFDLKNTSVEWATDLHYTTDPDEIEEFFACDDAPEIS